MRCKLFEKYQKIVADGVQGTTDITAANFAEVHVALIGPYRGNRDGFQYNYYAFKILPPYKFADDLDTLTAKKFFNSILLAKNISSDSP